MSDSLRIVSVHKRNNPYTLGAARKPPVLALASHSIGKQGPVWCVAGKAV